MGERVERRGREGDGEQCLVGCVGLNVAGEGDRDVWRSADVCWLAPAQRRERSAGELSGERGLALHSRQCLGPLPLNTGRGCCPGWRRCVLWQRCSRHWPGNVDVWLGSVARCGAVELPSGEVAHQGGRHMGELGGIGAALGGLRDGGGGWGSGV